MADYKHQVLQRTNNSLHDVNYTQAMREEEVAMRLATREDPAFILENKVMNVRTNTP